MSEPERFDVVKLLHEIKAKRPVFHAWFDSNWRTEDDLTHDENSLSPWSKT